ncbi:MAG: TIGR02302 family protein, partial [Alphaproteobacteria bacterium]
MQRASMTSDKSPPDPRRMSRLDRTITRARLAMVLERLWPRLIPLLTIVGLFMALSWLGLWRATPDLLRYALLVIFAGAAIAALVIAIRTPIPARREAVRRVEIRSNLDHRPASGLRDTLSPVANDTQARTLWQASRLHLLASLKNLRAGAPQAEMARRDPNALRFAVPVLLVVAFAVANGEHRVRLGEAFAGSAQPAAAFQARIDAWIDPPTYTRQAPIFLSRLNTNIQATDPNAASTTASANNSEGEATATPADQQPALAVPAGSRLTIRIVSRSPYQVELRETGAMPTILDPDEEKGSQTASAQPDASNPTGEVIRSYSAILNADGSVAIVNGDAQTRYAYTVIPDEPPTISRGEITVNRTGSFTMDFNIADDYGVRQGAVTFRPAKPQADKARPLVEAPKIDMRLGRSQVKDGSARAFVRLDDHPYAGMKAVADATVVDDAEQVGQPEDSGEMVLPIRPFRNPIARALVEQRRNLALDANRQHDVAQALDALTLYPEIHIRDSSIYLGLTIAYTRLINAETDDQLRDLLDYLWAMARQIEDGVLSDAEDRLNAAREALEDALERGAGEEEIARAMEELRQAMNEFLQEFAQQMSQ